MQPQMVNSNPTFPPPTFAAPPPWGYLHIGATVAPPAGAPFVRRSRRRATLLRRLQSAAPALRALPEVRDVSVFRAVLVPPLGQVAHPARFDVAMLVETTSPDHLAKARDARAFHDLLTCFTDAGADVHVMAARCVRCIREVDRHRPGLFLFNHFVAANPDAATRLWEHLAGWYVAKTGLDNSTLLAPIGESDYALVNHARWDTGLPTLAAKQFLRPSFRRCVRGNLRANHVVAMPVLYRLARPC